MEAVSRQVRRAAERAKPIVQRRRPAGPYIDTKKPVINLHHINVSQFGPHERTYHATKGFRWRRVG